MLITTQKFNGPGLGYIVSELSRFGGVRQSLLDRVKGTPGTVFVYWPSPIPVSGPDDFRCMLYDTREFEMGELEKAHDQQPINVIRDYLNGAVDRYLLVQADHYRIERSRDGRISSAPGEQIVLYRRNDMTPPPQWKDEPWIFISGPDVTSDDVELTFARGMLWPRTVGILTELPSDIALVHGEHIARECVEALVRGLQMIVFVAFDRQLLLLWQPAQP